MQRQLRALLAARPPALDSLRMETQTERQRRTRQCLGLSSLRPRRPDEPFVSRRRRKARILMTERTFELNKQTSAMLEPSVWIFRAKYLSLLTSDVSSAPKGTRAPSCTGARKSSLLR